MLVARDVRVHFPIQEGILRRTVGHVRAVDGVSLQVERGKTLGLVGESGCGKSTLAKALMQLVSMTSGTVSLDGLLLDAGNTQQLRAYRRRVQMVFQDPAESLNSRHTLGEILAEPMDIHTIGDAASRVAMVQQLLSDVGLVNTPLTRYPHEFSGGQRQRIGIARALALKPDFLICDEPVSALDVSVQAQILNLIMDLQDDRGVGVMMISHDLSVIRHVSHTVGVMYLGHMMEYASAEHIFAHSAHPYTRALLDALPRPDPRLRHRPRTRLVGDLPSASDPPSGCPFQTRCPQVSGRCREERPLFRELAPSHWIACHHVD
ncbi:MAG: ATP-binding cassette domain-containing protein [Litorivicinaceae bacterium]|jgi:peptide/nickel transport system ATP-binding protein|nr:ATP-binding cassette domain-containing protein [Litorivicinaceae bacterium]MDP5329631.1 ATP-binding cassette domain-containing protein [Litorivicinaceae bacterium]MDP5331376.1 ATP-binding cassette domain-containing protein [Litorivicinaceae bacterium]MDP5342686.1 ATP-binding cassette domain-containing protein [Litorivicinaceae bacterium]MDP5344479.1 ATP-binding cassette domain-containing protein [Litorivicinaceae bacterium]